MLDLRVDVDERLADPRHRLVAVPAQVLDGSLDDGERRAQLVARVRGELTLAAERGALRGERLADRHEGAPRVDRPEGDRDEHDHESTAHEDQYEALERPDFGRAVLHDLDEEPTLRRLERDGQLANRHGLGAIAGSGRPDGDARQPDVAAGCVCGARRLGVRQAIGHLELARSDRRAVGGDEDRERAAAAEQEVDGRIATARRSTDGHHVVGALLERRHARGLERRGDAQVEGDAQDEKDEERRAAAPGDEAPADVVKEPRIALGGSIADPGRGPLDGRCRVSHRPAGSPRRAPSRSSDQRRPASCAGSGRTRRPRSG